MTLLEKWRNHAYQEEMTKAQDAAFWNDYFAREKAIYEKLLADPDTVVSGTLPELAEKFGESVDFMVGFTDGINDSLVNPNPIETMDETTVINYGFDKEKLYYNMVACKAKWLYELPAWDNLIPEERRKELYREQKASGTIVKGKKIGRNDPCPCGSGKKYKHCCGR